MMLMTEDNAKTKWCPHAIASHQDPRAGFRDDDVDARFVNFPCIASRCMAWRWLSHNVTDGAFLAALAQRMKDTGEKGPIAIAYVQKHREEFGLPTAPTVGWCGLAGRPDETPKERR